MNTHCGENKSYNAQVRSPFYGCGTMVFQDGRLVYSRTQTKKLTKRNIIPFIKSITKLMQANVEL